MSTVFLKILNLTLNASWLIIAVIITRALLRKLTQIDTENVRSITEFVTKPDVRGGSGANFDSVDLDNLLFMKSDEVNAINLKNGVTLTGYGIVDGKFHIQLRFDDILHTDNHGYVYLKA